MYPKGGSEIAFQSLLQHVTGDWQKDINFIVSACRNELIDPNRKNIIWQQLSYDQQNVALMSNPEFVKKVDCFVYVSNWSYEKFRVIFKTPEHKSLVIKNAIEKIEPRKLEYTKGDPVKLIYTSTPWRGLNVLLAAMQLVKNTSVHLDVYSSTQVYGDQFKAANDDKFQGLYNQAAALKNVSYIGYKPNEFIKDNLKNYHMFIYPNIWEETSCIAAIEAMAAGLYCITTDYGALFETGSEYITYIPYEKDFIRLAHTFASVIDVAAERLGDDGVKDHLKLQIDFTNRFYSWDLRKTVWNRFLQGAINAGRK